MKFLWFVLAVVALGMAGLYGWYGSLHPCDMLIKDVVRTRAAHADLEGILRGVFAPVRMTPGECVQALARLHISPNEAGRLLGEPTEPGAAESKAEKLRALEKSYQDLLNPPTKGDTQQGEPGYNSRMREEMRRAIEGVTGSEEGAQ